VPLPIVVTVCGIVIAVSAMQAKNALLPIVVNWLSASKLGRCNR
jgi:hypothetical protein